MIKRLLPVGRNDICNMKDFLFLQLRDLPYFRAFLRAVESSYYQDLPLPAPIYDVGCGDGHFASLTFDQKIDVGLDPWHGPIHEAQKYGAYHGLVEADGASTPFPAEHFASGFSNSVLEHIPHIDAVLTETARVLKKDAPFYFCVPNTRYLTELSISRVQEVDIPNGSGKFRAFHMQMSRMCGKNVSNALALSWCVTGIIFRPRPCAC